MPISHPTFVFAVVAAFYTLPSLIAVALGRRHQWGVFAVNLATGWTVIGWMASLRWALAKSRPRRLPRVGAPRHTAECVDGHAAATGHTRMDESWADAAIAPDLYTQWLDDGAVRRESTETLSCTAPVTNVVAVKSNETRINTQRKPKSVAPTSAAA